MTKETDLSFIDRIEELSAISPVIMEVITLLNNPNPPIRPIVTRIELDPGMTSFVLKYCNSPLFPLKAQVNTVAHALNMLGIPRAKAILLTYFFKSLHRKSVKKYIANYLWEHSVNVAFIARELAVHLGAKEIADEAYVGGLLHDIGKLVLAFHKSDTYEKLLLEADKERKSLLPLERENFKVSHLEAGHYLVSKWGFADVLKNAVLGHHDLKLEGRDRVLNFVTFANCTAHAAIDLQEELPEVFLEFYGLSREEYERILDEILGVVIEARLMHLD
ncbi:MAG: HDOD domain-containing protein [bacterium]|nr:HDOD domain-containing protein [bacterium]